MIATACTQPRRYDAVCVYNFSRFFRDEYECEGYRRRLERAGVKLISAAQDVDEGPHARSMRSIFTSLDAAASEINAEQVKVAMTANAEPGFHNGCAPPRGYRASLRSGGARRTRRSSSIRRSARSSSASSRCAWRVTAHRGRWGSTGSTRGCVPTAGRGAGRDARRLVGGERGVPQAAGGAAHRGDRDETSITSLFVRVEKGIARPDDPIPGERLAMLHLRLSSIGEEIVRLDRQIGPNEARVMPETVAHFADVMRKKLLGAEDAPLRCAYVRGFVDDDTCRDYDPRS